MKFTMLKNSVRLLLLSAVLTISAASMLQAATFVHQTSQRISVNFDRNWLYNSTNSATFSQSSYSDGSWTPVCVPHTNKLLKHAYFNGGTIYTAAGAEYAFTSWYRKHYTPAASLSGRRFLLEFEGVATACTVYVNGTKVGTHNGAYTPFTLDITSQINTGVDNVIAVEVDASRQSAVPPEGGNMDYCVFGGIVRNVNLIVAPPLYTKFNWTYVPKCSSSTCLPSNIINSQAKIVNTTALSKTCTVITTIVDKDSNVVATGTATGTIAANDTAILTCKTSAIATPHYWYPDTPYLYTVYTQVLDGSTYVDEFKDRTGFRSIYIGKTAADPWCYINGQKLKMRGANRHETYAYIGRAAAPRLQRKDADFLKYELGCNTVRCSHYTQAPDFIKRCDEIGLMLIQEVPGWGYLPTTATWVAALMQDLKDMIYRDRNRPSVVSFGVRINESADNNAIYGPMNDTARAIDPSRPTHGVRRGGNTSTANFLEDIYTRNFADAGATGGPYPWFTSETVGHNAGLTGLGLARSWSTDDTQFTSINMYVTEQNNLYSSASYIVGKLAWCAFDYLSPHNNATAGEKGDGTTNVSRGYMSYVSPHGLASLFRLPKLGTYLFQSQRDPILYGPMIFIANDWTGRLPTVTVFSNCDSVELFLNGVSQGKKKGTIGASLPHPGFQWALTYTAGTLKAVGYIGGVVKATHTVSTPSAPVRLVITADDASINDGGDMTRIVISLVDSSGRTIRGRADSLQMSATGAGEFIGEARSALEGGQFAFYVKTGDQFPSGTITCNASLINNTAIAAVSTTVQVVPQGTTTGIATTSPSGAVVVAKQATLHKTIIGNKFTVPANIAKGSMLSVFDVAGKLLYRTVVQQKQTIDLSKVTSAAHAVYVVKIDAATISTTK